MDPGRPRLLARPLCQVALTWETAYATAFQIQVSADGTTWTTVYSTTTGTGGTQTLTVTGTGRYVRMYGTARATQYGYSLWEFTVLHRRRRHGSTAAGPAAATATARGSSSTAPVATRVVAGDGADDRRRRRSRSCTATATPRPYIGNITGIPSLCIPNLGLQDGPAGVGDGLGGVTQMPSGNASAATFDTALRAAVRRRDRRGVRRQGRATSRSARRVNIVRDPRWGRAFETFSEDPYLTGQMAAADIQGIQSQGVMAEVKHVAVYNIENPAGTVIVDNRTLQEIYLPAFQAAVAAGRAGRGDVRVQHRQQRPGLPEPGRC